MSDDVKGYAKGIGARIVGAKPSGVNDKIAKGAGVQIISAYGDKGKRIKLRGMRFIPSSKIDLGGGSFQILANTVIEIGGSSTEPGRAQSVDSVVTVGKKSKSSQILKGVKIPALDRIEDVA